MAVDGGVQGYSLGVRQYSGRKAGSRPPASGPRFPVSGTLIQPDGATIRLSPRATPPHSRSGGLGATSGKQRGSHFPEKKTGPRAARGSTLLNTTHALTPSPPPSTHHAGPGPEAHSSLDEKGFHNAGHASSQRRRTAPFMIGPASSAEGRRRVVVVGLEKQVFCRCAVLCSERSACTVGAGIFGLVWLVCSAPRRKVRVQT